MAYLGELEKLSLSLFSPFQPPHGALCARTSVCERLCVTYGALQHNTEHAACVCLMSAAIVLCLWAKRRERWQDVERQLRLQTQVTAL